MTRSVTEINSAIAGQLAESIGQDRFEMWFGSPQTIRVEDGKLVILADDELGLAFLRQHFEPAIREAINAVAGNQLQIRYRLSERATASIRQTTLFSEQEMVEAGQTSPADHTPATSRSGLPARRKPPRPDAPQPASPTSRTDQSLERFRFGPENLLLETTVRQVLDYPGKFNPLVLHGPVGCGKSHLLRGIVTRARNLPVRCRAVCLTAEQFTTGFIDGLQGKGLPLFRSKYRQLDLLAIDDIQFLNGKRATIVEFGNTVEALLRSGKQIVVTASRPLFEMEFLGESLITRLASGMSCPVAWPDLAARRQIARQYATDRNMDIDPDVLESVCQHLGRDVRMLTGALNRVHAAALATRSRLDHGLASELLGDLIDSQTPVVSLQRIEDVVCDVCGVRSEELKSSKRIKRVSTARMLAIWLSRRHTTAGLAEIGEYYGGRNHSTIVAARKKIDALHESDADVDIQTRRIPIRVALERLETRLRVG